FAHAPPSSIASCVLAVVGRLHRSSPPLPPHLFDQLIGSTFATLGRDAPLQVRHRGGRSVSACEPVSGFAFSAVLFGGHDLGTCATVTLGSASGDSSAMARSIACTASRRS